MPFTRSALLKPNIETQLAEQMLPLWRSGLTAEEIKEKLFTPDTLIINGEETTNPFHKLKKFHVWNYRTKFNKGSDNGKYLHLKPFKNKFKPRKGHGIKKGSPHYKVPQDEPMSFREFKETLNSELPTIIKKDGKYYIKKEIKDIVNLIEVRDKKFITSILRKRAYLILHFWTCLRKSEIYEREEKNFKITGDSLKISLFRKKKYYKSSAKPEPFFLKLELPLVDEVVNWVFKYKDEWKVPITDKKGNTFTNLRPFNFNSWTAWNYVKSVFPNKSCHFFRASWITKAISNAKDPRYIINELLQDTGLNIQTIRSYIMDNPRFRGAINVREAEMIKEYEQ